MKMPLDPWLGLAPSKGLAKLYAQISDLLNRIDSAEGKPSGEGWRSHLAFDRSPRLAVPLVWKEVGVTEIDRCDSMLSGPLFTSTQHPWPKLTEARNDKRVEVEGFCEPILQINMDLLTRVAGQRFEKGLVQVWMDGYDSVVRFIPERDVQGGALHPVPAQVLDFFSNGPRRDRNIYRDWSDSHPVAPWLRSAFYCDELCKPFHEYPEALEYFLEDLGWSDLEVSDAELERLNAIASELHDRLIELDGRQVDNKPSKKRTLSKGMQIGKLFGRFRSVQEDTYAFFDCAAIPLIDVSDSNGIFYWGNGTAQLITPSDEPGAKFRFEWSKS